MKRKDGIKKEDTIGLQKKGIKHYNNYMNGKSNKIISVFTEQFNKKATSNLNEILSSLIRTEYNKI